MEQYLREEKEQNVTLLNVIADLREKNLEQQKEILVLKEQKKQLESRCEIWKSNCKEWSSKYTALVCSVFK